MEDNYVELLFVQDGTGRQVVEVPAYKAEVGDMVEYILPEEETENVSTQHPERTSLGLVLKKMWCQRFDNDWSCIAEIAPIRRGKKIWKPGWSRYEQQEA